MPTNTTRQPFVWTQNSSMGITKEVCCNLLCHFEWVCLEAFQKKKKKNSCLPTAIANTQRSNSQSALSDLDQVIALKSDYLQAYIQRGWLC